MDQQTIEAMIKALKPTLKSGPRAMAILERLWTRRIAIVWSVDDVHRAANECEVALTNREASDVLRMLLQKHDKQHGLKWEDLTNHIDERVLGRRLTKAEVKRFVENGVVTVARQHR